MSAEGLFAKMRERMSKVDPNNRKVLAVFQIKSGDLNWVIDTKELKVYEGVAENADATITADLETFTKLVTKEMTMEEAKAQGKVSVEGDIETVLKAQNI